MLGASFGRFKYISCYSLSTAFAPILDVVAHLNTSHVILYPITVLALATVIINLNTSHVILYRLTLIQVVLLAQDLNTSHVILYQLRRYDLYKQIAYLNTSHVILYLNKRFVMIADSYGFKYISCYSLSVDGLLS